MRSSPRPRARIVVLLATAFACWSTLAACGQFNRVSGLSEPDASDRFRTEVLAASRASVGGEHIADMVNPWGVAIRPAEADGHFWMAGGGAAHGASLGDIDALYFTAGPDEERAGVFGSLRPAVTGLER